MNSIPKLFFATGALFALLGMIWGIQMSATDDHTLSPAHGHLNLIGFVVMSIFGIYYALTPQAAQSKLAWIQYGLVTLTVLMMAPGIVLAITANEATLAKVSSVMAVVAMAIYGYTILKFGVGERK